MLVHRHRFASVRQEIRQRLLGILLRLTSAGVLGADGEFFAFAIWSLRVLVSVVLTDIRSLITAIVDIAWAGC
jgi:hypothetical protein